MMPPICFDSRHMNRHLIFSTRFGEAALIYRARPFAVIKTILPRKNRKELKASIEKDDWGKPDENEKILMISRRIIHYFKGNPVRPPWKWMDMDGLTKLQKSVLVATADIPYGETRSYKAIAEAIDRPRAYRFVGTTLANNPFPALIPCHRVIKSNASIGRFGGGTDLKRRMIELEAKHAPNISVI